MDDTKNDGRLHVKMFGKFSVTYNGREILDGMSGKSQFALVLETIIHNRAAGAGKNLLAQTLFEDRDIEDVSHSIRNILYNAKKKLRSYGLPDTDYFRKKNNLYFWTDEIEVVEDTEQFETLYKNAHLEADPKKRFSDLVSAMRKYTGMFLQNMETVAWMSNEAIRLKSLFHDCVKEIETLAVDLQLFRELEEVGRYACKVDPYSEWEVLVLRALIALSRYEEAESYYNTSIDRYIKEYGSNSSDYLREIIKNLSVYMVYQIDSIDHIQTKLQDSEELKERGGYYCSFPIFQELYRTVERVMQRSGDNIYLMLCTIVDSKGNPIQSGSRLDELSDRLAEALLKSVRHSDTVTKYGKGQYLLLLFDTSMENCSVVQRRIDSNFIIGRQRTGLTYSVKKVILNSLDDLKKN